MKKVVAIGELLIDFVPQQRGCALDEVVQFERVAGGAPANVATAVARLGGRAQMISQVGEDAFGTHILKTLHANGVNISTVFRTGRANTALAFVSLDKNGNREFSFYRNPSQTCFSMKHRSRRIFSRTVLCCTSARSIWVECTCQAGASQGHPAGKGRRRVPLV